MKKKTNTKRNTPKWKIVGKTGKGKKKVTKQDVLNLLLKNRGLTKAKEKKEFLSPRRPGELSLVDIKVSKSSVKKAVVRIGKAIKDRQKIIVYGDYDADGICATAIIWEYLYSLGADVLPYIPERFSEGYGLNSKSLSRLKEKYPKLALVFTVDNGIVATDAVSKAKKLGIDVIVSDHHQKGKKIPKACAIIHTTKVGGAGLAWFIVQEAKKTLKPKKPLASGLDLATIGTISDQIPLLGPNRSLVKYGLTELNETKRPGLRALFQEGFLKKGTIGVYSVGFTIAPRINAMGRLAHGIDSLRLLCTRDSVRAKDLSQILGRTNKERQVIVGEVVLHADEEASGRNWEGAIVLAHSSYHEGVIGLAASKLVEKYYRPAIVFSKGKKFSKASARSVPRFNMIEAIMQFDGLIKDGGGHPMAAGFTIETKKIDKFIKKFEGASSKMLAKIELTRELKIDMELDFSQIDKQLVDGLASFGPTGIGNPTPTFATKKVVVVDMRLVGADGKHLKLKVGASGKVFDAIAFGFGNMASKISPERPVDIAYSVEENYWNGDVNLQLKIRSIRT